MNKRYMPVVERFMRIHMLRRAYMHKNLNIYGLHFGQHPILKFISENDGCTQKEIADLHGVTTASIALSTKRMQCSGLICKSVDKDNLRKNKLSLTEKGEKALKESEEFIDALDEMCFSGFDDEDIKQLYNFLGRIADNMSDIENSCTHEEICMMHPGMRRKGKKSDD
ncbi:MAG: hypothetical protein A2Y17_13660 [Clostridiales bacterium GWF2_38_85]|nr:MAG: hypothetical protein A2Y17_13660 [Clostridiales bacterium GWF2_38_85]